MPKKNRHQASPEELKLASGGVSLSNLESNDVTVKPGETFKPKDGENYGTITGEAGSHIVIG